MRAVEGIAYQRSGLLRMSGVSARGTLGGGARYTAFRLIARDEHRRLPWRRPIASLNYLLTSHVWRQDRNGFSHQAPGFVDLVMNKSADILRVYLPPDAN